MASSLCKTTVFKVYQEIMDDVIQGVRELFLEDGVDEQVLQELKQTWETKLLASKAVDNQSQEIKKPDIANGTNGFPKLQQQTQVMKQIVGQVPPNNHVQTPKIQVIENKMVPVQIALPAQPGGDGTQRVLTIQVPSSALQGNQLHKILTGPVITATMNLPQAIGTSMLQQHVNAAFSSQQQALTVGSIVNRTVIQNDGVGDDSEDEIEIDLELPEAGCSSSASGYVGSQKLKSNKCLKKNSKIIQMDGAEDTSDDDDDDDNDTSDDDEDKDDHEQDMDEGGSEAEPLNSEDDVTDEDHSDLFDTENVVVCQYDKITRIRNKWKFHLKDGIMNLNGEDYVFQKANGDAEW